MTPAVPGPDHDTGPGPERGTDPGPGPDATPGRPADPRLAGLLRWYPRAWRERYGDEFLAMVEDTLDGRKPGWRLHLSVVWAGLRERARRAVPAALRRMTADADPPPPLTWLSMVAVMGSAYVFWSTQILTWVPLSAEARRQARGAVTADAIDGLCVLLGVAVIASGLTVGPALARFLRAGGWLDVRRQVARAAAATAAAAAALTQFLLLARSMTIEQVPGSVVWFTWFIAALVPLGAALRFWRQATMTMATRLELQPGVRAVQIMLNAVATTAASAIPPVVLIWDGQTGSGGWLMIGAGVLYFYASCGSTPARLWWAWHRAQQLRAAAAGGR